MNPKILLLMNEQDASALRPFEWFANHFTFVEYTGVFDGNSVAAYIQKETGKFDAIAVWEVSYESALRAVERHFSGPKVLVYCGGWYEPPPGMYILKVNLPIFELSDFDRMVEEAFKDL